MTIELEVPGPQVSVNRAYRGGRGRFFMAPEAVAFKERVMLAARLAMRGAKMLDGAVAVSVEFFYPSERPDIDGPVKLILDSLQGIVFENDRQVRLLWVTKESDKKNPRTKITCTRCIAAHPREFSHL